MKINTTQILKNYQGKPIFKTKINEVGVTVVTKEKLSLRNVISTAINATSADRSKPITADQKGKAYQISIKIWSKKEVNLTIDDMAFIKERVLEVYNPLVSGRVGDIFEEEKKKEKK